MSVMAKGGAQVHPDEYETYAPVTTFDEDVRAVMSAVRDDRSISGPERYRLMVFVLDMHDAITGAR